MLCSNCEFNRASLQCTDCHKIEGADSVFCSKCSKFHSSIKAFKDHSFEEFKETRSAVILCTNCETEQSQFQCNNCPESDSYFCGACSIIHSKIKSFRNHRIKSVTSSDLSLNNHDGMYYFARSSFNHIYFTMLEHIHNINYEESSTIYYIGGIVVVILAMVRYFLGRNVTLLAVLAAVVGFRFYQSRILSQFNNAKVSFENINLPVKKKSPPSPSRSKGPVMTDSFKSRIPQTIDPATEEHEFANEFWHDVNRSKAASLRPRVRPYKKRQSSPKSQTAHAGSEASNFSFDIPNELKPDEQGSHFTSMESVD